MQTKTVQLRFSGTGQIGNRLFRGNASLTADQEMCTISGSALRGQGKVFLVFYWICGWLTAFCAPSLVIWISLQFNCFSTSPTPENFANNSEKQILDLAVTALFFASAFIAPILLCRFVLRKTTTTELPAENISKIVYGTTFEKSQEENQPPIIMSHITIKMKPPNKDVRVSCRKSDVSSIASWLHVPLE